MEEEVPRHEKISGSHIFYKVKVEECGGKIMKARFFPHGSREKMRHTVKMYSATAPFDVIRMLLIIYTLTNFRLGCIYIKGSYL